MPNDGGPLREIAWRELFPWLLLLRSFRLSIQVGQLMLAAAGVLLTIFGWWLLAQVFSGTNDEPLKGWVNGPFYQSCPWREQQVGWPWGSNALRPDPNQLNQIPGSAAAPDWQSIASRPSPGAAVAPLLAESSRGEILHPHPPQLGRYPNNPFWGAWLQLGAPFRQLFDRQLGITGLAFLLCCCLWAAAVWAIFGGAITRRAALQFGREENLGVRAALGYAAGKWSSYFVAPLLPLVGLLICASPLLVLGLLMRLDIGLLLAGVVWPLALVASFIMALLLLALLFGWPLMWPTISTEGTDSFDALSRSWSYVYHRPLHYLFYAVIVTVLGGLGWLFIDYFASWVAYLPIWAASWTAGNARMDQIFGDSASLGMLGRGGANLIYFWNGCVRLAALGFVYSYFWTASTAIYFLLRRDDDGTDLDDIHVDAAEQAYGLPPLEKDSAGVPLAPQSEPSSGESTPPATSPSTESPLARQEPPAPPEEPPSSAG